MLLPTCLNPRRIIVKSEYAFIGGNKGPSFLGIDDFDNINEVSSYASNNKEVRDFHSCHNISTAKKVIKDFNDVSLDKNSSYYYADELRTLFEHAREWEWYDRMVLTNIDTKTEYMGSEAVAFIKELEG